MAMLIINDIEAMSKRKYTNKYKLDRYEQDIEDNLFKCPPMPSEEKERWMKNLMAAAKTHVKDRIVISLQISKDELKAIKSKASKQGLPYDVYC